MSRKDYILIAEILRTISTAELRYKLTAKFAFALAEEYTNFNKTQFMSYVEASHPAPST